MTGFVVQGHIHLLLLRCFHILIVILFLFAGFIQIQYLNWKLKGL